MKKIYALIFTILMFTCKIFCAQNEVFVKGNKTISDFYIQKFNTTVEEYNQFLKETGTVTYYNDDTWEYADRPLYEMIISEKCAVANISFIEIVKYANWLSKKNNLNEVYLIDSNGNIKWNKNANGYRLPTCEEWEWAARGGIYSKGYKYPGADNLDDVAWYNANSNDLIHFPGTKKPNELDIYDMFGNVGEWCWDEYISIPDIIILEGENRTPMADWIKIATNFSADSKHQWNRISMGKIKELNIEISKEYLEKYSGRATYYTTFWKDERVFIFKPYSINEKSCSYMGIRLVRNIK